MNAPLAGGKSRRRKLIGTALLAATMLVSLGLPLRPAPWNAMEITLAPRKLSDGVYALVSSTADTKNPAGIPEGTTGGIIVGGTGVLVIEARLNTTLAHHLVGNVKKLTG